MPVVGPMSVVGLLLLGGCGTRGAGSAKGDTEDSGGADSCPSGALPSELPPTPQFLQVATCRGLGEGLIGTPDLAVIQADDECGELENGAVFVVDVPSLAITTTIAAERFQGELGYVMALSDHDPLRLAMSWYNSGSNGVLVTDLAGSPVAAIEEPASSLGNGVAWSGGVLILGDHDANDDAGMLFVFDNPASMVLSEADAVVTHRGPDRSGLGYWMNDVDDVDGDGLGDLVFSTSARVALLHSADVLVQDGVEFAMDLHVSAIDWMAVGNVGDLDGDGLDDVGISDHTQVRNQGEVAIFSSTSSDAFASIYDPTYAAVEWGHGQGGIGDPDGDGREEALIIAFGWPSAIYPPQFWLVEAPLCGRVDVSEVAMPVPTDWEAPLYGPASMMEEGLAVFVAAETDGSDPRVGFLLWD